jgi:hypothetical protein
MLRRTPGADTRTPRATDPQSIPTMKFANYMFL